MPPPDPQKLMNNVWSPRHEKYYQAASTNRRKPILKAPPCLPSLPELLATFRETGPVASIIEQSSHTSPNLMEIADILSPSPALCRSVAIPALAPFNHPGFTAINNESGPSQSTPAIVKKQARSLTPVGKGSIRPDVHANNEQSHTLPSRTWKPKEVQNAGQQVIAREQQQKEARFQAIARQQMLTPQAYYPYPGSMVVHEEAHPLSSRYVESMRHVTQQVPAAQQSH